MILNESLNEHRAVTIVSRATLMTADVLVIAVTWANTYRLRKASHDARVGGSFSGLLLRDGEYLCGFRARFTS